MIWLSIDPVSTTHRTDVAETPEMRMRISQDSANNYEVYIKTPRTAHR